MNKRVISALALHLFVVGIVAAGGGHSTLGGDFMDEDPYPREARRLQAAYADSYYQDRQDQVPEELSEIFTRAVMRDDAEGVRFWLEHGLDPNERVAYVNRGEFRTRMHTAAGMHSLDACRVLLEHGAAVNALDTNDETAIDKAFSGIHSTERMAAMIQLLVEHGALPRCKWWEVFREVQFNYSFDLPSQERLRIKPDIDLLKWYLTWVMTLDEGTPGTEFLSAECRYILYFGSKVTMATVQEMMEELGLADTFRFSWTESKIPDVPPVVKEADAVVAAS